MHHPPVESFEPLAYLDPGSGSILLQLLLASILGLGVLVRSQWKKIISFFVSKREPRESGDEKSEKE